MKMSLAVQIILVLGGVPTMGVLSAMMLASRKNVLAKCGHRTPPGGGVVYIDDEERLIEYPTNEMPELCLKCMKHRAVHCLHCERPILPGDTIMLHEVMPDDGNDLVEDWGFYYDKNRLYAAGCLQCGSGDFWGVVTTKGTVERIQSAELVDTGEA